MKQLTRNHWWLALVFMGLCLILWMAFSPAKPWETHPALEEQMVQVLTDALSNTDPFVRSAAAKAISDANLQRLVPLLNLALDDPYPTVRLFAIEGSEFLPDSQFQLLIEKGVTDPDSSVRLTSVRVLAERGRRLGASSSHRHLLSGLGKDPDLSVRLASLAAMNDPDRLEWMQLFKEALRSEDEALRASTAYALGLTQGPETIPLLSVAISDPSPSVRSFAVRAVGKIPHSEGLRLLQRGLSDFDPNVRSSAASALASSEATEAVPLLLSAISDEDDFVRLSVAIALVELGREEYFDLVVSSLRHPDYSIRSAAARSFSKLIREKPDVMPLEEAEKVLAPLVFDEMARVRSAAIRAIAQIGSHRQIPLLKKALQDPSETVKTYAAGALMRLLAQEAS